MESRANSARGAEAQADAAEKFASDIEQNNWAAAEARTASHTAAAAKRRWAAVRRANAGFEGILEDIEKNWDTRQADYAMARKKLKSAIDALGQTCAGSR